MCAGLVPSTRLRRMQAIEAAKKWDGSPMQHVKKVIYTAWSQVAVGLNKVKHHAKHLKFASGLEILGPLTKLDQCFACFLGILDPEVCQNWKGKTEARTNIVLGPHFGTSSC